MQDRMRHDFFLHNAFHVNKLDNSNELVLNTTLDWSNWLINCIFAAFWRKGWVVSLLNKTKKQNLFLKPFSQWWERRTWVTEERTQLWKGLLFFNNRSRSSWQFPKSPRKQPRDHVVSETHEKWNRKQKMKGHQESFLRNWTWERDLKRKKNHPLIRLHSRSCVLLSCPCLFVGIKTSFLEFPLSLEQSLNIFEHLLSRVKNDCSSDSSPDLGWHWEIAMPSFISYIVYLLSCPGKERPHFTLLFTSKILWLN